MCTSYIVHISRIFVFIFRDLEHRHFLFKMLRWCLVCVFCNSKSFHSLVIKRCIMSYHTMNICTFYFVYIDKYFLMFRAVELSHCFHLKFLGVSGCLICNSSSFHSFIFNFSIMIVHILNMCTLYFVHI